MDRRRAIGQRDPAVPKRDTVRERYLWIVSDLTRVRCLRLTQARQFSHRIVLQFT